MRGATDAEDESVWNLASAKKISSFIEVKMVE